MQLDEFIMILTCHKCLYITRICPNFCVLGGDATGKIVGAVVGVAAVLILVGVFLYFWKKSESVMECDQQRALEHLFQ